MHNLIPLSHKLEWTESLPSPFKGIHLPGSTVLSSVGDFGSICIQEYANDHFSIRFNVFDLLQQFVCKTFLKKQGMNASLVLKGRSDLESENGIKTTMRQNQFAMIHEPARSEVYEKNLHITFDAFLATDYARPLVQLYPAIGEQQDQPGIHWADTETLELVHTILRCKYEKEFRRHFFESRVKDLFFKYLALAQREEPTEKEPTQTELNAIYKAEAIITNDLAQHYSIPAISKKILLNEFRFKSLFKKIFGIGPYEYLVRKRLQRSKELLEEGFSVKETAAKVGYRPTDFATSFRNHFGFPPSTIKRKNS